MPKTTFENAVVEQEIPQATVQNEVLETNNGERTMKDIIKELMAKGCKRVNDVTVKNVIVEEFDNYTRATLVTREGLDAFVSDDNGATYHKGKSNNLFSSTFAIAGAMKEDEELSWMANSIVEHPNVLNLILNGSKIDVIIEEVPAKTEYINPFTTKVDKTPVVFENDTYVKYVVGIKLGKSGQRMADKLADKLMGF